VTATVFQRLATAIQRRKDSFSRLRDSLSILSDSYSIPTLRNSYSMLEQALRDSYIPKLGDSYLMA
jgi:hypothetical protein